MLAVPAALFAQPVTDYLPEDMLEAAEKSVQRGDYYSSLEWYEKYYAKSRDRSIVYKVADINYRLRDYKRAVSWFKRVVVTYDLNEQYPDARFKYARSLKMMGDYPGARSEFKEFVATTESDSLRQLSNFELIGIELAMESNDVDPELIIENMGRKVNTSSSEYSPIAGVNEGELYFASMKAKKIPGTEDGEDVVWTKIYKIQSEVKRGKLTWNTAKEISPNINLDGAHTSNVVMSQDQTELLFTRARLRGNDVQSSKIYRSKISSRGTWGPAEELDGINGDYVVRHPAYGVHLGKEVIFFSANILGGFGGSDIYYATRKSDNSFGDPINLGPGINTLGDEVTPYYFDGTLYFSSDGLPGFGGQDIFTTSWENNGWAPPKNMSKSYNTSVDEVFFRINADGETGYLVSNREGTRSLKSKTCCNDIYSFRFDAIDITLIAGTYAQRKALLGATIQIFEIINGVPTNPIEFTNKDGFEFEYPLQRGKSYKVKALKEGYFPDSTMINTVAINENTTIEEQFILTVRPPNAPPPPKEPEFIEEVYEINQPIRLNNIYYDFDDDKILPDAEQDLQTLYELLLEYEDMIIELSSHTDAQGPDGYNRKLSSRRANSAKKWLVEKGINSDRIEAVGYGEKFILNQCENGVECSDDEHRFNRRTEFKIIDGPTEITIRKKVKKAVGATPSDDRSDLDTRADNAPRPEITYEVTRWDFRKVRQGTAKSKTIKFTNTGTADLIIEVVTACNCTELIYPKNVPIPPGEGGEITIRYDSSTEKLGKATKDVTIVANTVPVVTELFFDVEVVK